MTNAATVRPARGIDEADRSVKGERKTGGAQTAGAMSRRAIKPAPPMRCSSPRARGQARSASSGVVIPSAPLRNRQSDHTRLAQAQGVETRRVLGVDLANPHGRIAPSTRRATRSIATRMASAYGNTGWRGERFDVGWAIDVLHPLATEDFTFRTR